MKTYRVGFYYTEYGTATVQAKSKEQAERKVFLSLENDGLEKLVYRTNDRDYDSQEAEEVTE